jgi:hypothetical protein
MQSYNGGWVYLPTFARNKNFSVTKKENPSLGEILDFGFTPGILLEK